MPSGSKDTKLAIDSRIGALNRAIGAYQTLSNAVAGTGLDWTMLAAIGLKESRFSDIPESNGGLGVGWFQIDLGQNPGVSAGNAQDLAWAAGWAARTLVGNANTIAQALPVADDPALFTWMVIASWNTGARGQVTRYLQGNNPDYHTSPYTDGQGVKHYHDNYGQNVIGLMSCFK